MIIATQIKGIPGDIITGEYERNEGEFFITRFKILGIVSKDAWINYRKENNLPILPFPNDSPEGVNFYYVHTD